MEQIKMKKTEKPDRCAMASCDGTMKKLTLRGCTERCGQCDARRPSRRIVKCSECKIVYHRGCAKKLALAGGVDGRERDVRPTAVQQETVAAADEPADAEATAAVRRGRELMAADSAIMAVGYIAADDVPANAEATAAVRGGHDLLAADGAIMRAKYAATDERGTTTTTIVAVPSAAADIRTTIISPSEYFQYLLVSETERRKAAAGSTGEESTRPSRLLRPGDV